MTIEDIGLEIEFRSVSIGRVRPGDVIVVTVTGGIELTVEQTAEAKKRLSELWPDNESLVIAGGEIQIVRPATEERDASQEILD